MKALSIFFLAVIGILPGSDISNINKHKKIASEALKTANFVTAIQHYSILTDSLGQTDEGLILNLGNAYYSRFMELNEIFKESRSEMSKEELAESLKSLEKSIKCYEKLSKSSDRSIRAKANNQAGVILMKIGDTKSAEELFKEALKANPYDENIRYNYELAKKMNIEEEKKKEEEKKNKEKKDQKEESEEKEDKGEKKKEEENSKKEEGSEGERDNEDSKLKDEDDGSKSNEKSNKDGGDKDDKSKDGKSGGANRDNEKESDGSPTSSELRKRLQEINMSKERAKMILEAIKNQETQYYQQMIKGKRKSKSSKPKW